MVAVGSSNPTESNFLVNLFFPIFFVWQIRFSVRFPYREKPECTIDIVMVSRLVCFGQMKPGHLDITLNDLIALKSSWNIRK